MQFKSAKQASWKRKPKYYSIRKPIKVKSTYIIPLTKGEYTIIDAVDYPLIKRVRCWQYANGYATTCLPIDTPAGVHRKTVCLHQLLNPTWKYTDHKDRNRLNNRRSNLREATMSQNNYNRSSSGKSKYKGVSIYRRKSGKPYFRATIKHNYKYIDLGYFYNEEEAGRAYDKKAKELFGEFAKLNFKE